MIVYIVFTAWNLFLKTDILKKNKDLSLLNHLALFFSDFFPWQVSVPLFFVFLRDCTPGSSLQR